MKSAVLNVPKSNSPQSGISISEFLDFLKVAYQVSDSVEQQLLQDGMIETVDWIHLKESQLVKPPDVGCQTSEHRIKLYEDNQRDIVRRKSDPCLTSDPLEPVKGKLNEVLAEGLLDSVLTYIVPSTSSLQMRRSSQTLQKQPDKSSNANGNCVNKKKSGEIASNTSVKYTEKTDSEVVIHVCDEVKNVKRDFFCSKNLLVDRMGYFADIATSQRLEDMDISVHCDVNIFEWLMKWLKKDEMPETEELELDSQCVIPILVSAAFLQMEPLQQECLLFCHLGMNEILRTSTNLSCLNDTVITRLAAMYTNTEVEAIRDRKDRVQSKLYCKLIQSLCEPEPESVRGHWRSFARIYRCQLCQQLVSPSVATEVPCVPSTMHLHCDGSVTYSHVRDPKWDIHVYMEELYNTLRSWRKIYWRLWGDAHFLFCGVCKRFFPAHQIAWCRYHPDSPQFFTVDSQRVPLPVGRYPCCGERAYRFQIMDKEEGCQFREHTPITDNIRDSAVFSMLNHFRHLIEMEPPKLVFPERLVKLVARAPVQGDTDIYDGRSEAGQQFWWEGFEVIPQRPKLGLLGAYGSVEKPDDETATAPTPVEDDYSASSESSYSTSDSSGTENKSEESSSKKNKKKILNTRGRKTGSARLWQYNLSARSNQDIQRTNEEGTLKQVTTLLGRRCMLLNSAASSTKVNIRGWPRHITPPGGIWVRLECEWRERNNLPQPKLRNIFTGKPRFKSSRYNHVQ